MKGNKRFNPNLARFAATMYYFGSSKVPLGPSARIGWPNRFMVFTYVAWLMIVALAIAK